MPHQTGDAPFDPFAGGVGHRMVEYVLSMAEGLVMRSSETPKNHERHAVTVSRDGTWGDVQQFGNQYYIYFE